MDNFTYQPKYKKILPDNKKCSGKCPFNCYLCIKVLGGELIQEVYKKTYILIEKDRSIFDPMFERCSKF